MYLLTEKASFIKIDEEHGLPRDYLKIQDNQLLFESRINMYTGFLKPITLLGFYQFQST